MTRNDGWGREDLIQESDSLLSGPERRGAGTWGLGGWKQFYLMGHLT